MKTKSELMMEMAARAGVPVVRVALRVTDAEALSGVPQPVGPDEVELLDDAWETFPAIITNRFGQLVTDTGEVL